MSEMRFQFLTSTGKDREDFQSIVFSGPSLLLPSSRSLANQRPGDPVASH